MEIALRHRFGRSPLLGDLARAYALAEGSRLRRILECVRSPGVHAVVVFRFGKWALENGGLARVVLDPLYHALNLLVQIAWGIEISRRASVGPGLYIGHFGTIIVAPGGTSRTTTAP